MRVEQACAGGEAAEGEELLPGVEGLRQGVVQILSSGDAGWEGAASFLLSHGSPEVSSAARLVMQRLDRLEAARIVAASALHVP